MRIYTDRSYAHTESTIKLIYHDNEKINPHFIFFRSHLC